MVSLPSYHFSAQISAVHPVLSVLGSAFFFFLVLRRWGQLTSEPDITHVPFTFFYTC